MYALPLLLLVFSSLQYFFRNLHFAGECVCAREREGEARERFAHVFVCFVDSAQVRYDVLDACQSLLDSHFSLTNTYHWRTHEYVFLFPICRGASTSTKSKHCNEIAFKLKLFAVVCGVCLCVLRASSTRRRSANSE